MMRSSKYAYGSFSISWPMSLHTAHKQHRQQHSDMSLVLVLQLVIHRALYRVEGVGSNFLKGCYTGDCVEEYYRGC